MLKPTDLGVVKSDVAASILAVAVWQAANRYDTGGDALREQVKASMLRHANELLMLHDLKPADVLTGGDTVLPNRYADHES